MIKNFYFLLIFFLILPVQGHTRKSDTLIVGYEITPPFIMEDNENLHGPSLWLWERIARRHDIPFKLVELPLDGLLGALESREIDFTASPLTITSNRLRNFDFSVPYYIAHSSILTQEISDIERAINFIGSFFTVNFFRAVGALIFIILVFGYLEWFFERKQNENQFGHGLKGLWNGFWWSAVTMTTVGYGDKAPVTPGGRIVALIWMFTAVIIISGFTASIASSLTVDRMSALGDTLQDFREQRLGTIEKSATDRWLRDNFYTRKFTYSNMEQLIDALERDEIDAIAYDQPILQNLLQTDTLRRFRLENIIFNPSYYGIGMNPELPEELKKEISITIMEYIEGMDWKVLLSEYNLE